MSALIGDYTDLIVIDVDALELKVGITMVGTGGIHTVLIGDDLPELGTNLVAALTALDVNDFTHSAYLLLVVWKLVGCLVLLV